MRERKWISLGPISNLWLTVLLGLGTVYWYASSTGTVWFLSQTVTVTFLALAMCLAVRRAHPAWIGLVLGLTMWARPNLVLALPFFAVELFSRQKENGEPFSLLGWIKNFFILCAPLVLTTAALLWYNWARFGNLLDFGYTRESVAEKLASDLLTYGQFNLHFLARNVYQAFMALPDFHRKYPFFTPDAGGLSIFFVTPALVYLFRRLPRQLWTWGAWGAILLLNIPLLLYYNTGWVQFGYRFSLDYIVPAICLIAASAGKKVSPLLAGLIILSVLINLRGVQWWFLGQ